MGNSIVGPAARAARRQGAGTVTAGGPVPGGRVGNSIVGPGAAAGLPARPGPRLGLTSYRRRAGPDSGGDHVPRRTD